MLILGPRPGSWGGKANIRGLQDLVRLIQSKYCHSARSQLLLGGGGGLYGLVRGLKVLEGSNLIIWGLEPPSI